MVIAESNNNIIDGLGYSKIIKKNITQLNNQLKEKYNICSQIAIILVGNNIASEIYVRNKIKLANEIGIIANVIRFNIDITEEEILKQIENINNNNDIDGVIVQLPLPTHINKDKLLLSISPRKDIDGLNPFNVGLLTNSSNVPYKIDEILKFNSVNDDFVNKFSKLGKTIPFIPCTPLGCLYLIEETLKKMNNDIVGKNAVIIGNSNLVSKPMARVLLQSGATTTTLHSKSIDKEYFLSHADIIVSATGKKQELKNIKPNAILIDIGIRQKENEKDKITGDLDFYTIVKTNMITPVPRGVGPMTVISLMINAILSSIKRLSNS